MIQALNLRKLRNSELIQFCRDYISIINNNDPQQLSVASQLEDFTGKVTEMETVFKSASGSAITAEIEELDLNRDKIFSGIVSLIEGNRNHFDPEFADAAETLQNNLKIYNTNIIRENLQSETALLNNIITDWENKPELTSAVGTLNLGSWITQLKTANQNFNQKYLIRSQESAGKPTYNIEEKRPEIITAYRTLCKRLDAFAEINDSPAYGKTIHELNAVIEKYIPLTITRKKTATVNN